MTKRIKLSDNPIAIARVRRISADTALCVIISLDGILHRTVPMSMDQAEDWILQAAADLDRCITELTHAIFSSIHGEFTQGIFSSVFLGDRLGIRVNSSQKWIVQWKTPPFEDTLESWSNTLGSAILHYLKSMLAD